MSLQRCAKLSSQKVTFRNETCRSPQRIAFEHCQNIVRRMYPIIPSTAYGKNGKWAYALLEGRRITVSKGGPSGGIIQKDPFSFLPPDSS